MQNRLPWCEIWVISLFFLLAFGGVAFYSFTVMSSTIFNEFGLSHTQSLLLTITGVSSMMLFEPIAGKLADVFGSYRILSIGIIGIMIISFFHTSIILSGNIYLIYMIQVVYGMILAMYMAVTPGFLTSLIKKEDRCRILGLGYNIPLMIFGGSTPLIILYITRWSYYAVSAYLILISFVSLYGIYLLYKRNESYDY